VSQNQCRTADILDHLGHREGLPGTCDPQQNLVLLAIVDTAKKLLDGLFLIPPRMVIDD